MNRSGIRNRTLLLVVALVVALHVSAPATASASQQPLRVRKSVTELTAVERAAFVEAVLALTSVPSPYDPSISYFDQFPLWHVLLNQCSVTDPHVDHRMMGHAGPMFLPWHREFLLLFEDALREVSGTDVTVPYWDWTDPESVASVFADDFMGGDGDPGQDYAVTTGPFRKGNFELVVEHAGVYNGLSTTPYITRRLGSTGVTLPTAADVAEALGAPFYDVAPYDDTSDATQSFRNALEGFRGDRPVSMSFCAPEGSGAQTIPWVLSPGSKLHNPVHGWVGGVLAGDPRAPIRSGTMTVNSASPNDPVFFLHHANVDRLWAEWQEIHGVDTYQPVSGYKFNNADDVMRPFDGVGIVATPADVEDIAALGYSYTDPASAPPITAATPRPSGAAAPPGGASAESPLFCRIGDLI